MPFKIFSSALTRTEALGNLILVSRRVFKYSILTFAFIMFSCLFPTGFSAVFSSLAIISSVPLFFQSAAFSKLSDIEKAGLLLFAWLAITIIWSSDGFLESLGALGEYRIFFIIPFFVAAIKYEKELPIAIFKVSFFGCFIALSASYLIYFDVITSNSGNSLANRIFHGFIMSLFLYSNLLLAYRYAGFRRLVYLIISIAVIVNVLMVENGRTGYILALLVPCIFVFQFFPKKYGAGAIIGGIGLLLVVMAGNNSFSSRASISLENLLIVSGWAEPATIQDDQTAVNSSIGRRFEFYKAALRIGASSPIIGIGVGSVESSLEEEYRLGEMAFVTDNVHSEWLNQFLIGGAVAIILFANFLISHWKKAESSMLTNLYGSNFLKVVSLILAVSCLFNSSIKDYGEKHILMIVISALVAFTFCRRERGCNSDKIITGVSLG